MRRRCCPRPQEQEDRALEIPRTLGRWEGLANNQESLTQTFREYRTVEDIEPVEMHWQTRYVSTWDIYAQAWATVVARHSENNGIYSEAFRRKASQSSLTENVTR